MDAKVSWRISPDVDLLVGAIAECKKLLIACVKRRNPYCRSLKLLWCDVHASPKLVELLHVSDLWTDHRETTEEVDLRRAKRPYSQEVVADFIAFRWRTTTWRATLATWRW